MFGPREDLDAGRVQLVGLGLNSGTEIHVMTRGDGRRTLAREPEAKANAQAYSRAFLDFAASHTPIRGLPAEMQHRRQWKSWSRRG